MAEITIEKLRYYYERAQSAKDGVTEKYNEVLNYTDVSYQISEDKSDNKETREIEEVISESITTIVNFIMSNVFPRGLRWASLEMNETLFKQAEGNNTSVSVESKLNDFDKSLENMTGVYFDYLNNSNFYTEVSKAVRDDVVLGTGVLKVIEQTDVQRPFVFKYQTLSGFYFLQNIFGEPDICFKKIFEVTKEDIEELYGKEAKIPDEAAEENKTIEVIECMVPNLEKRGNYFFIVYDSKFETEILKIELDYKPFIVFRWELEGDNIWGTGLGVKGLKLFKDLEKFKALREEQSEKIVNPPLIGSGDKGLINNIVLKSGYLNYGGTLQSSVMEKGFNGLNIEPINTSQSLIPVDQDIAMTKAEIKNLFMSNPLGDLGEGKNRSATEVQARMQLFRSRWSGSYELTQHELMRLIFMAPLKILIAKKILSMELEEGTLDFTVIQYENELSKTSDMEDVQMLNTYGNSALNISNVAEQIGLSREKTVKYIAKKLRVPEDLKLTDEENAAYTERIQQRQDQIMAERALTQALESGELNNNQEVPENGQ
jgi:hypothetical protein